MGRALRVGFLNTGGHLQTKSEEVEQLSSSSIVDIFGFAETGNDDQTLPIRLFTPVLV